MCASDSLDALLPDANHSGPSSSSTLINEHLSFPSTADDLQPDKAATPEAPRQLLKDRLYIGNLHPSVDEYSLLQIFSKFGKVTKLDFLFHRSGLLKGKPRGYAFIEYGNQDDALKALTMAHDKLLRGRKIIVTYAQQAPLEHGGMGMAGSKHKRGVIESGRPTTLSLLKTGVSNRHDGTQDKIAKMEAKLRQMERTNPKQNPPNSSISMSTSTLPSHPSLPLKPIPSMDPLPSAFPSTAEPSTSTAPVRMAPKLKAPLPTLPIMPPVIHSKSKSSSTTGSASLPRASKPKLLGVKIKPKEKEKTSQTSAIKPEVATSDS